MKLIPIRHLEQNGQVDNNYFRILQLVTLKWSPCDVECRIVSDPLLPYPHIVPLLLNTIYSVLLPLIYRNIVLGECHVLSFPLFCRRSLIWRRFSPHYPVHQIRRVASRNKKVEAFLSGLGPSQFPARCLAASWYRASVVVPKWFLGDKATSLALGVDRSSELPHQDATAQYTTRPPLAYSTYCKLFFFFRRKDSHTYFIFSRFYLPTTSISCQLHFLYRSTHIFINHILYFQPALASVEG